MPNVVSSHADVIKGYKILPFHCELYGLQMSIHAYVNTYKICVSQAICGTLIMIPISWYKNSCSSAMLWE